MPIITLGTQHQYFRLFTNILGEGVDLLIIIDIRQLNGWPFHIISKNRHLCVTTLFFGICRRKFVLSSVCL